MAISSWPTNASTAYIIPKPVYQVKNSKIQDNGFSANFTRTSLIGVASLPGSTVRYYVYLYTATDISANPTKYPGYYYRILGGQVQFSRYATNVFGTKPESVVLGSSTVRDSGPAGSAAGSLPSSSSPSTQSTVTVSSSTAQMYAEAYRGQIDLNELQRISRQSFTGTAAFAERVTNELRAKGYSQLEIQAYLRARDDKERGFVKKVAEARVKAVLDNLFRGTSSGGPGGSSGSSGGGSSNGSNPGANFGPITYPELQTRLVVRMPSGYVVPDAKQLKAITMPAINQTFLDDSGKVRSYTYTFDYIPNNIQYSNLGSEWVEIPRAENYAFVDWSRFKLMRVSMSWVVALDRVEPGGTLVHDGMFRSVDSNILSLRRMADRKHPITIVNMDDLLSVQLKVTGSRNNPRSIRGMQFVITDLSITAARRTSDPATGQPTTPSKIAVAQCQMTLQEVPIESVQIVSLPKLQIPFTAPKTSSPPSRPLDTTDRPLTSNVQVPPPSSEPLRPISGAL